MTRKLFTLAIAAGCWCAAPAKDADSAAVRRIEEASRVLTEIMETPDQSIPKDLLDKAHCIVIVPGMKTGGFIVGAKYGKGVLMCRKTGGGWKGPGTVRVEGGSVGFQIGAGEVDSILLIMNESGARRILRSKFKIGGEAAAMAGPVGRKAQAETDAYLRAEILGYSRSRGAFAGVALTGSTLRQDLDDNAAIYQQRLSNVDILENGQGSPPEAARSLASALTKYSAWEQK